MVFFQRLEEDKNKELEASKEELKKEREKKKQIHVSQVKIIRKNLETSEASCSKAVRLLYPFPSRAASV
jgi:hypothetical protein